MQTALYRLIVVMFCISFIMGANNLSASDELEFHEIEAKVKVPGEYLKAWNVAYSAFSKIEDLSDEQKKLKYYDIEFSEDNENYIVLFLGRLLSAEEGRQYKRKALGRTTRYWIDKDSYKSTKRFFYKD
ncbi:MAG: hypothetical protein KAR06_04535 [Deltaproteobacteria bacterium]|nr:hypothetical protein [Deltaproteobacteria bacterium]